MSKPKELYVIRGTEDGVYDSTDDEIVYLPVNKRGDRRFLVSTDMCYKLFSRYTGLKLKPGEVAKIRITAKVVKS